MRASYLTLLLVACCEQCNGFTPAVSGGKRFGPRALSIERQALVSMNQLAAVVQIFSSHLGCPDSLTTKRLLGSHGIEYTEHDCSSSEHNECSLKSLLVVECSSRKSTFRCSDVPMLATGGILSARLGVVM